jgi:hypothetical protein
MAQDMNRFVCEGCGKQYDNRTDLQNHSKNCPALKGAQQGASNRLKTKTAGGGQGLPESQ